MNRIKEERRSHKLTQGELAEMLNVDVYTIWRWEHDINCVKASSLLKLSDTFDCSTDYLLERTSNRKPLTNEVVVA